MRNILTIAKRDLTAYFTSPIGYIFMMVFVTMSVGIYITQFFTMPSADMRYYFSTLPIFLCVFVPAVTMRIWAEERKENTWEMLLTFPMQARELVLGKFLAALVFFALTLFATITLPAMLFSLGNPDGGAVFGGYLGTFLLGALFLSIGIFFSGFFKDQIVAFVVSLLTCFLLFLLGTTFIASYIDGRVDGLGTLLANMLGFSHQYESFGRGVVDLADVFYFLAWTTLFIVLNILYIDGRNRPKARTIFGTAVGLSLAIGLLFNWVVSDMSLGRFDLTEDKIYTVSPASADILSEVNSEVTINLYITHRNEMPTALKSLEQEVTDTLDELSIASGGKLQYKPIYLKVDRLYAAIEEERAAEEATMDEEEKEEKAVEARMLDKGVQPFSVQAFDRDEMTTKAVYSSMGIAYGDKPEEIIPQVLPQNLTELEYRIVSTVYKLSRPKAPVLALVAARDEVDPQMRQILQQMGQPVPPSRDPYEMLERILGSEKYEVRRVDLTQESPMPALEEFDTLAVVNPRALNERQRWEINRVIRSGKPVLMAVQNYTWNYQQTRNGLSVKREDQNPGINELLSEYGLGINADVLMDQQTAAMRVQSNDLMSMLTGGQPIETPMQIVVNSESMNPDTAITNRLSSVFYLWGSALELDDSKLEENDLTATTIMESSDESWTREMEGQDLTQSLVQPPPQSRLQPYPLMAIVEGQFPDAFEGATRPAWPAPPQMPGQPPQPPMPDDSPNEPVTPAAGKLLLIGCANMFREEFVRSPGNLDLFMNSVDALSLSEKLVNVRSKKPIDRSIAAPSEGTKSFWRFANFGLANIVIAGVGIGLAVMRRRSRDNYTVSHIND